MQQRKRVIVYSNEMVGLGHLRRTLAILDKLTAADPAVSSLVLTGSAIEPFFPMPPRCDTVKLPSRSRDGDGNPCSRLELAIGEVQQLRARIALAAAESYRPHLALVDKLPLGLGGELEPTLRALRADPQCRLVLGLRDIEDSPANVRRKWTPELRAAIERYYDAIVVYGPESTPDAIDCAGWSDLSVPTFHVGYVGRPVPTAPPVDLPPGYLLATTGGGHDGFRVLASLAEAIRRDPVPCPVVMVTGPLLDGSAAETLADLVRDLPVHVFEFRTDMDRVIAGARGVVAMAGYNTVGEIMRARVPALLVPRVRPSEEQLVRARLLARSGAQDMLHPGDMTPASMRQGIERLLERPRPDVDLSEHHGEDRAVDVLAQVAGLAPRRRTRRAWPRPTRGARVAVIASGFPRLSETFALNEMRALADRGTLVALFATKPGDPGARQPGAGRLLERLEVLPDTEPAEQAAWAAERLRGTGITGVHGYFAHTPAEVAAATAAELDVPFGFSTHARDARKLTPEALADRTRAAACVVACNPDVAAELPGDLPHVRLIPHGVDLGRFSESDPASGGPLRLLTVGRLVEKKGLDVLLAAVSGLTVPFHLRIVGDGPLRDHLSDAIAERELAGRVELVGARTHEQLPAEYAASDLVVVPSVVDAAGDRDGLPNVLLEAMASGRPVIASDLAGLRAAVDDTRTGLLVPPGDPAALAGALDVLGRREAVRRCLGVNARRAAERDFDLGRCTERFAAALEVAYA